MCRWLLLRAVLLPTLGQWQLRHAGLLSIMVVGLLVLVLCQGLSAMLWLPRWIAPGLLLLLWWQPCRLWACPCSLPPWLWLLCLWLLGLLLCVGRRRSPLLLLLLLLRMLQRLLRMLSGRSILL
jgi:hypothetical protein